jgi:hypothetical protein
MKGSEGSPHKDDSKGEGDGNAVRAITQAEQAELIRYLLNDLSPSERERMEERYFSDDDPYYETLEALETELVRDYVAGDLSSDQRRLFEARMVSDAKLSEQVALVESFFRSALPPVRSASYSGTGVGKYLVIAAAFAIVLLISAALALLRYTSTRLDRLQVTVDALVKRQAADETRFVATQFDPTFSLIAGVQRSAAAIAPLAVPRRAALVHLQLLVPEATGPLHLALRSPDTGFELWSVMTSGARQVEASIPASILSSGDYLLSATTTTGRPIESWPFRVVRP